MGCDNSKYKSSEPNTHFNNCYHGVWSMMDSVQLGIVHSLMEITQWYKEFFTISNSSIVMEIT